MYELPELLTNPIASLLQPFISFESTIGSPAQRIKRIKSQSIKY